MEELHALCGKDKSRIWFPRVKVCALAYVLHGHLQLPRPAKKKRPLQETAFNRGR